MELAAASPARSRSLAVGLRLDRRTIGAWVLGFGPVLYLALRGGGYDLVIRSEVGLAAWWIVLLGVLVGALPLTRVGRLSWTCAGLLTAFLVWSLIASSWSSSSERTIAEVARLATYLGLFVLAVAFLRRDTLRPLVSGIGAAFGIVGLLAVLSRLYPGAFPHDSVDAIFGRSPRLNYPLNYANGTGNLLAIGLPLLLLAATRSRTIAGQALGAAAIPVAVLGVVLTASRGGALTAIVAVLAFFALSLDRLPKLATGITTAAGSTILIAALLHRTDVRDNLSSPAAISQRHQMTALVIAVCIGVALVQVGIALASRYLWRPSVMRMSRRQATVGTASGFLVALLIAVAIGLPGQLSHQWQLFKQTDTTGVVSQNVLSRLGTVTGSHRYQYWQTAVDAWKSKPLTGIGPGTFEFYWEKHGSISEFIRNAHSLYLETLAETGIIGLLPLIALLLTLLIAGVVRTLRAPPLARASLAAATASLIAFCVACGYDWMWQLAVAPIAALLLGAAILAYRDEPQPAEPPRARWVRYAPRAGVVLASLGAIVVISVPYGATSAIRSSQSEFRAGRMGSALADTATAQRLEPYAATPWLQRALILESSHDLKSASLAINQATARESQNWQVWLVRARIEAESGRGLLAVRDYRRAHALNPLSPSTAE
jgi:O-Antigen ligase